MKRSKVVVMGAVVVAAAGVVYWAANRAYYDELCAERSTYERVADGICDDGEHNSTHTWVYIRYSRGVKQPAYPIGSTISHPKMTTVKPSSGNFVRGGFGGYKGGFTGG